MSNIWCRVAVAGLVGIAGLTALAACGDNSANPAAQIVVRTDPASAADCPYGGSVVLAGVDTNGNGALDDSEITQRTPLCNPPPVQPPPKIVVRLVAEPPGTNCALGGTAVESGPDLNGNGVLDDNEVAHIDYVCGEVLLTRLIAEPPGATCIAGGVAFQVGRDRNHDGVLSDDEVEQTEIECGTELSRDVAIGSAADAAALAKIEIIDGSLTVGTSGLGDLALPALTAVRGSLAVRNEPALAHLAMPVLQSVAGQLALTGNAQLASLELPLLSHAGSLVIDSNPALPDLSAMAGLTSVPGDIQITNNAALTAANLPFTGGTGAVTIDGNAQLGQLALHPTSQLGPLHIGSNPALTSVTVGRVPGSFAPSVDRVVVTANAQLAQVSFDVEAMASLAIDDNPAIDDVSVSSSSIAGDLAVRGNGRTSLTLVNPSQFVFDVDIGGAVTLSGPITALHVASSLVAAGDCTVDTTELTAFDPNTGLSCGGSLHVTNNALLMQMPGMSIGGSVELRGNPALTSVPFFSSGAFVTSDEVSGDLVVVENAALQDLSGFDQVGHVAGNVTITGNPVLKSVFGTALTRIDGSVTLDSDDSLGDLGFANLGSLGALSVSSCGSLTALDLPALRAVGSRIDVRGNAALVELQLPVLRQADMGVFDNPQLPACAVDALFAGLRGDHQQSGNDGTAECTP